MQGNSLRGFTFLGHDVSKEKLPSPLGLTRPLNMTAVPGLLYPKYDGSTRSAVP
jgi:hypothetical protein